MSEPAPPFTADGSRLVAVADLGRRGVVEVRTSDHGTLAVGMADDEPFAVSNRCRHWLARLGQGQVRQGCLQCPWHGAKFDVRTGVMVDGPKGKGVGWPPYSNAIKAFGHVAKLRSIPVTINDGYIELV